MYKFDFRAFPPELNASAVSLGSLATNNMLEVPRNWAELAENERPQRIPLRNFYKGLRRKTNLAKWDGNKRVQI